MNKQKDVEVWFSNWWLIYRVGSQILSSSSANTFIARYSFVPPKTLSDATRHWKAASEATAAKIVPGLMPDSKLLLILACLFANCELPLNILLLEVTPRKR